MAKTATDWQLKNLDTGEVFIPPYPVAEQGVKVGGVGGVYAEIQRFGMDPVANWVGSKTRTFTFSTVMFAESSDKDISGKLAELEALASPDEALGRPPICVFTYCNTDVMVLVETVDMTIGTPRDDGTPRLVTLEIGLRRYRPFSQVQIDPTKPAKECYYLVASAAEATYEGIARRYYGSALAGDRLRRRHPDMPMQPDVGAKVKVPPRSMVLREVVSPAFHAHNPADPEAAQAFRDLLDRRAERKVVA